MSRYTASCRYHPILQSTTPFGPRAVAPGPNDLPEIEGDPWDAFLPDEDQIDPLPERGDFWGETDAEFEEDTFEECFGPRTIRMGDVACYA